MFYSLSYSLIALILPSLSLIPWSLSQVSCFSPFLLSLPQRWCLDLLCFPVLSPILPLLLLSSPNICVRDKRENSDNPLTDIASTISTFSSPLYFCYFGWSYSSLNLTLSPFIPLPLDLHTYSVNSSFCLHFFTFTAFLFYSDTHTHIHLYICTVYIYIYTPWSRWILNSNWLLGVD